MKFVVAVLLIALAGSAVALNQNAPAVTIEMVDYINSQPTLTWKAGFSKKFEGVTLGQAAALCGSLPELVKLPEGPKLDHISLSDIPDSFDSRTQWGSICPSTSHIRDQGACGSCWAFGAAEAMTDRACIATNGASAPILSAADILSCCGYFCGDGCQGGYPSGAWGYYTQNGVVTGGDYNSGEGCMPYPIAACDHHVNGTLPPCGDIQDTPECTSSCAWGYNQTYSYDKHFAAKAYSVSSSVSAIQKEIMTYGPVEATYSVYEDFLSYKSGVYQYVSGDYLGGHAIKIIGWGVDNGTPYWTVANSWNTDWGNAGFFNILRGKDEVGIEDGVVAGLAKIKVSRK